MLWPLIDGVIVTAALVGAAAFVARRFVLKTKTMRPSGPTSVPVQMGPRLAKAMKRRKKGASR